MKVRALASISGPMGRKAAGEEFTVSAAEGKGLLDRKLVEQVETPSPVTAKEAPSEKPAKTKVAAQE